jgi:hypothetical protein
MKYRKFLKMKFKTTADLVKRFVGNSDCIAGQYSLAVTQEYGS